ncbi:MAG: hypothetical protein JNM18_16990 [Planctomycetaceae bacterium]|nr:hypothetical protein [Planctomycetaceae bacterium]
MALRFWPQLKLWAMLLLALGGSLSAEPAQAAAPLVMFDSPSIVAVRDITTTEFATLNPGEKLIDVVWHVSAMVARGGETDVDEVIVTIQSPERRARVVDFAPRTELSHDFVGPIHTSSNAQQHASLKVNLNSGTLNVIGPVQGTLDAARTADQTTTEQFQRLPPRSAVLASGTTTQGHGVFFKLRRWSQASIEGAHQFRTVLAVPQSWRGDWMHVSAQARAIDKNLFGSQPIEAGEAHFAVGLHLEADREARQTVERLVRLRPQTATSAGNGPLPKLAELLAGKSSPSAARQDHERVVTDALRAVRKLSGSQSVR